MNPPSREASRVMLESLCARSRIALVLADPSDRIAWASQLAQEAFPGQFPEGATFSQALQKCTVSEVDSIQGGALSASAHDGELRRSSVPSSRGTVYRYFRIPLGEEATGSLLHYLINVSDEKRLKQHYIHNLQQLKIMKEIVDVLYESLSTQEVIYLTLVAVTSQIGFGFNRAFFLHVSGNRLCGRFGIGPSNHEEAHQIWTRIASLNFSSLREVYNDLTRNGGVPDPRTQEIALRLDFDVSPINRDPPSAARPESPAGSKPLAGLLGVLQRGKPACLEAREGTEPIDRELFHLLSTDAVAVVPLWVRGRLAGLVIADNFITRKPITDGDLNMLKTFAGYAGVALERSQLYDELRDSVAKLQSANETLKANQQKLLQAEKLSAIGELAAYVSHEIRNPLVAIGGLARSLLKDEIEDPDTVETLQIIVSEVTRLEKFLKDTLDYVKPRMAPPTLVDLNGLAKECLATFREELSQKTIEAEVDLAPEPPEGLMDRDLLLHALSNLIKNAIEAIGTVGRVYLGTRVEDSRAVIRVGDTGCGISAEVLPRIFDPFFTTKSEGTGLGLSLASQNIRSLGGQLELEPSSGFKTVFKISLPLERNGLADRNGTRGHREEVAAAREMAERAT